MGRSIQWTEDMRKVLMLLRTETEFKDDKQRVAAVFNQMFATTLRENGYQNGMDPKRIADTWNSRRMAGRSRGWLTVDDPPKNGAETRYRQQLLRDIDKAVVELGYANDEYGEAIGTISQDMVVQSADENPASNSKLTRQIKKQTKVFSQSEHKEMARDQRRGIVSNQNSATTRDNKTTNNAEISKAYMSEDLIAATNNKRRPATPLQRKTNLSEISMDEAVMSSGITDKTNESETSQKIKSNTSSLMDTSPLEMVHAIDKEAVQKTDTALSSAAFISHDDPVYQLGGRVYSEIVEGKQCDVMVCNRNRCRCCNKETIDFALLTADASETKGMPFVHLNDTISIKGEAGFRFVQAHREYNNKYPEDMWKPNVKFSDGVRRRVMMCVGALCDHCSGTGANDKKRRGIHPNVSQC